MSSYLRNSFLVKVFKVVSFLIGFGGFWGLTESVLVYPTYATTSSVTLSISGNPTINLPPTAEGKFADSGNTNITVSTTHAAGYTLSIRATGAYNPTSLDSNGGATSGGTVGFQSLGTVNTCPSGINTTAFDTPDCNGYWGYKPSKRNGVNNTNNYYYASPTTSGETLDTTSDNSNGSYTVSIGARANINTAIGSYSNTFVFTVTVNPTPYTIAYADNSGEATGMPSSSSSTTSGETATNAVSTTIPTRTGYDFKGWCSISTNDDTCSGTIFNPDGDGTNRDLTVNQTSSSNTYTLYAMWGEPTMQRVAVWGGGLAIGDEVTARDERDDKEYTVARVCTNYSGDDCTASELWMTQNLDLDIGVTGTAALTSVNTDLYSAYDKEGNLFKDYALNDTTGVISWTPTSANTTNSTLVGSPATISNFAYGATGQVTGWTNKDNNPYMAQGTLSGEEVYELPTSATTGATSTYDTIHAGLSACVTAAKNANPALTEAEATKICKHYKIGNYYNFAAANATSLIPTSYREQYAEMPNSICPKGWRLPRGLGDENGDGTADRITDFNKLLIAQGVTDATDLVGGASKSYVSNGFKRIQTTGKNGDPLYFARSGYVNGSNLISSSYVGFYWSSTVQSSSNGYNLYFYSGRVYPAAQYNRSNGRSVRCVAR